MVLGNAAAFVQQGGSLKQLEQFMRRLGPLDDPSFCFYLGNFYQESGLPRLAMQQFSRVHELVPEALPPQFALARLEILSGLPDQAMELINHLRGVEKTRRPMPAWISNWPCWKPASGCPGRITPAPER